MNSKYVRRKYCSNHSICAQVWYCSFCIQDSFVLYHISTSLRLWELALELSFDISLQFLPLSKNWFFSSVCQVKSGAVFEMHLQMRISHIQCLLISIFYCINRSCIDSELLFFPPLSPLLFCLFVFPLSLGRPSESRSIDEYKCHLMPHQLGKKKVLERKWWKSDGIKRKESSSSFLCQR